jgi:hypothetical protein
VSRGRENTEHRAVSLLEGLYAQCNRGVFPYRLLVSTELGPMLSAQPVSAGGYLSFGQTGFDGTLRNAGSQTYSNRATAALSRNTSRTLSGQSGVRNPWTT